MDIHGRNQVTYREGQEWVNSGLRIGFDLVPHDIQVVTPMTSLRQILAEHGSLLVLDGSGTAQAAWFASPKATVSAARAEGDAGIGVFTAIAAVCPQPNAAGAFAFCESPGSVLGIRTSAAAIRTWTALRVRPVYAYNALQLAAAVANAPAAYIADARRGQWHYLAPGETCRQLPTGELRAASGDLPLVTLEGYRHWEPLPPETQTRPYRIGELLPAAADQQLFHPSDSPDAALIAQPAYVQWTPRIHQTP